MDGEDENDLLEGMGEMVLELNVENVVQELKRRIKELEDAQRQPVVSIIYILYAIWQIPVTN